MRVRQLCVRDQLRQQISAEGEFKARNPQVSFTYALIRAYALAENLEFTYFIVSDMQETTSPASHHFEGTQILGGILKLFPFWQRLA